VARQNRAPSANHCCCSWNCVKQAWAPLAFAGFALFCFEFGPADRINPIILDSYTVSRNESIEDRVEHGRRNPPEFSLQIGLSHALIRCPFERRK
jgi:hypothetical protein